MKRLVLLLYIAIILLLAAATLIEYRMGTAWVGEHIYYSPLFCAVWGGTALLTLYVLFRLKLWRRVSTFGLHLSFVVILAGALVTYLAGSKGHLHLRVGETAKQYVDSDSRLMSDLPFTLLLDTFYISHYLGTEAPMDYVSVVRIDGGEPQIIAMNRVLDYAGYRFYQSSFDDDHRGSWLSVNYDPWGTAITYIGYILMALSMIGLLVSRRTTFRRLLHHPLLRRTAAVAVLAASTVTSLAGGTATYDVSSAHTKPLAIISRAEADSLARIQVLYNDRVVPFNTVAYDFVKKLSGKTSIDGLTPDQIVGSWIQHPEEWQYVPIIKIKSDELRRHLGLGETKYVRLIDLMHDGNYRLRELWKALSSTHGKRTALEKAILETDEKVALVWMLMQGTLYTPLAATDGAKPLSEAKLQAELLYNRTPFGKILFMANLTLGFLLVGVMLARSLQNGNSRPMTVHIDRGATALLAVSLLFHFTGYVLRWYIGGRIPLSNGYETMQFMALCVMVAALAMHRRFAFAVPFGFLLSGFALLVSYLGQMNPQITPLMPVLLSPWLSTHVSFIMIAYSLLAFICLNGILALCLPREAERLMVLSRLLLYPATFLLGIGIFIGAVWANVSWGRYWAWDPKEVWALITFMVYGLAFHTDSIGWLCRPRNFHIYMSAAFLTVLMTYFGVNYLLGGMHSYA